MRDDLVFVLTLLKKKAGDLCPQLTTELFYYVFKNVFFHLNICVYIHLPAPLSSEWPYFSEKTSKTYF